jgi:hypothetical protein
MEKVDYNELETCELSEDDGELSGDDEFEVDNDYICNMLTCCCGCQMSLLRLMCCFLYTED